MLILNPPVKNLKSKWIRSNPNYKVSSNIFNTYFPGQECNGEESQPQQPGSPLSLSPDAAQEESEHLQPAGHQVHPGHRGHMGHQGQLKLGTFVLEV